MPDIQPMVIYNRIENVSESATPCKSVYEIKTNRLR